jgi:hypothetical protein
MMPYYARVGFRNCQMMLPGRTLNLSVELVPGASEARDGLPPHHSKYQRPSRYHIGQNAEASAEAVARKQGTSLTAVTR